MTLQVIKAEDVRDGEPRLYAKTRADADDALKIGISPIHLLHANRFAGYEFAIVDRPAPSTIQPAPVLDLDALAEAERAMTAGPWASHGDVPRAVVATSNPELSLLGLDVDGCAIIYEGRDATGIVALRNAAPHLIAEARAAVALRAERDSALDSMVTAHVTTAKRNDEIGALRAKLAEAKRLGLEACDAAREAESRADHDRDGRLTSPRTSDAIRAALEAL